MKGKKILVVGGAGYIGSHVNKLLGLKGYETVVFDDLSRGNSSAVVCGNLVKGDLGNLAEIQEVFAQHQFEAVFHFAALTDIGESITHPALYYKKNVVNTLNLLECLKQNSIRTFIFSSSAAIFGHPQQAKIDETHPCSPINPYGKTKWMVETILQDFDTAYGIKSCALRYFNAAGGDPEGAIKSSQRKENNLIPLLICSLCDPEKKVTLFGTDYPTPDGTCIRDYVHVCDLAKAHIMAMEDLFDRKISTAYNLGSSHGYSVREVVEALEKVTGKKASIAEGPRRPGDPAILVANSSKIKRELGWQAQYDDIEMIIAHAWAVRMAHKI